jgi:hypothetical protein
MGVDIMATVTDTISGNTSDIYYIPSCWLDGYYYSYDSDDEVYFDSTDIDFTNIETPDDALSLAQSLKEFEHDNAVIEDFIKWLELWGGRGATFSYSY